MMRSDFIKSQTMSAIYSKKEGTKSSYYKQSGSLPFPNRIGISRGTELTYTQKVGRNAVNLIAGQMVGSFTQKETSVFKRVKPYCCRTQIWRVPEYPSLLGYGTLGISTPEGVRDTGDLLVFYSQDSWRTIKVCLFTAMGNIDKKDQALDFASKYINEL